VGIRPEWNFFTPDLIEIGGYPFPIQGYKPTREEAVEHYRGVSAQEKLDIRCTSGCLPSAGMPAISSFKPTEVNIAGGT
jgi:hypothetical protein